MGVFEPQVSDAVRRGARQVDLDCYGLPFDEPSEAAYLVKHAAERGKQLRSVILAARDRYGRRRGLGGEEFRGARPITAGDRGGCFGQPFAARLT